MPKAAKLKELPKLEEWKAPWEVTRDAEGNETDIPDDEQVIDKPKLKKYLYGLLNDKITIRNSLEETTAEVEELQARVESAKDPKEIETLQADLAKARQERDEAKEKSKGDANALKWEIALEKGLTKTQAKRLMGSTREELEADADELVAEFGHQGKSTTDDGEGEPIARGPRRNLTNSGDPNPQAGKVKEKEIDPEEVARNWLSRR